MTRYSNGANFERLTMKELQAHGWLVTRAAGSHGMWDLMAVAPGPNVALVQCKRDGKMSAEDKKNLCHVALAFNSIPILAWKEGKDIRYSELFADGSMIEWWPGG